MKKSNFFENSKRFENFMKKLDLMDFMALNGKQFMELPLRKQLKKVADGPSEGPSERYSLGLQ